MDVEPTVTLAFTLEANPGSYALLLGAGVSHGVVPTSWEILTSLITRLAIVSDSAVEEPMAWYEATYGRAPIYGDVLAALSSTPAGRVGLLKPFFEGTPATGEGEEVEPPRPTEGHRAIARLMKAGFIKVVITTNFDRLLEQSLNTVGVEPTVLSTPADMAGALPLHQQTACIIKIHGDYLDPSFLNTGDELASYDQDVRTLLGRVLDDYGLIACGWSATWDTALRHELAAHNPRRYTNCWVNPSEPSDEAVRLIKQRDAVIIAKTSSAFFVELEQAILSLRAANQAHPTSVAVGVASAKRHITSGNMVAIHDLLASEFDTAAIGFEFRPMTGLSHSEYQELTRTIDGAMGMPIALTATAARWGGAQVDNLWVARMIELGTPAPVGGDSRTLDLLHYPATLILYSAGVSLLCAGRRKDLERLLRRTVPVLPNNNPGPISSELSGCRSLSFLGSESQSSQHVYDVVAPSIREHLHETEVTVRAAFDEMELMMALVSIDSNTNSSLEVRYASDGIIRRQSNIFGGIALPAVQLESASVNGVHPWIAEGLFDGDGTRLEKALQSFMSTFTARQIFPRR